jgi:hypothetical protein
MIEIIANDRLGRKGKNKSPLSLPLYIPLLFSSFPFLLRPHHTSYKADFALLPSPFLFCFSLRREHSSREMSSLGHGG